jgi:predicted signal transduction protein with EAL and GGDEF domain
VTYPEDGTDAQTLMRRADQAMYAAKSAGKNGFRFFGVPELNSKIGKAQDVLPVPHAAVSES